VAFSSHASNLVPGDTNAAEDVFVRDLAAGATTLASVNTSGTGPGNADSYAPTISSNGRFVMFHSLAKNLTPGSSGTGVENLFLRDLSDAITYALTGATTEVGVLSAAMTPDGHFIAFVGEPAGSATANLYVWDSAGEMLIYTNSTSGVSRVSVSNDGTKLAYVTPAGLSIADLLASTNDAVVVKGPFTSRAGLNFSGDGRYLVLSTGGAWAGSDTNDIADVYLYDVLAKTNLLVSHAFGGSGSGNGVSDSPVISPDGRFLVYRSFAGNLAPGDSNGVPNLFLYDQSDGTTTLLTASSYGPRSGANRSLNPFFSSDGQTMAFESAAFDATTNDFNQSGDIFAYNFFTAGLISYFTVNVIPGPSAASSPTLIWPTVPGKTYQVWFKNNLTDPNWEILSGDVTIQGGAASFTDPAPSLGQRFYKIVGN
jgi:Tol biopolymer transport system component